MSHLWNDQRGGIITTELVLVLSLVSAGALSGLTHVRNSVVREAQDVAQVFRSLNQTYGVSTIYSPSAHTSGSASTDMPGINMEGWID